MSDLITSIDQLDPAGYYTYQDYLTWRFKERVELFLGRLFRMSPAPSVRHQAITGEVFRNLANYLVSSPCSVFTGPFDVRLPVSKTGGNSDTVVQPDIVVICDSEKLDEQGCNGAPDIVMEILSPGNNRKEVKDKFELYEASQVSEYWIISPIHNNVIVYRLDKDQRYYGSKPFIAGEEVKSEVLEGFAIDVESLFDR